jgi:hypothetical protein
MAAADANADNTPPEGNEVPPDGGRGRGRGRGPGGPGRTAEASPLVIKGVMYLTTAYGRVVALEPETGKEIWSYKLAEGNPATRGLEYWSDRQKADLISFVRDRSKGFVASHGALTALNNQWPEFTEMIGGYFAGHPWRGGLASGHIINEAPDFPATKHFPAEFTHDGSACTNAQGIDRRSCHPEDCLLVISTNIGSDSAPLFQNVLRAACSDFVPTLAGFELCCQI